MKNQRQLLEEYIEILEAQNGNLRLQVEYWKKRKIEGTPVVYVLQQENTSNYKIGISVNYENRVKAFDVRLPFNMIEVATYETAMYKESEKYLHKYFGDKRLNGSEFFSLVDEDLLKIPGIISDIESGKISIQEKENKKSEKKLQEEALIRKAVQLMSGDKKISSSYLQRKLKIGYSRAARIKDHINLLSPLEIETLKTESERFGLNPAK